MVNVDVGSVSDTIINVTVTIGSAACSLQHDYYT